MFLFNDEIKSKNDEQTEKIRLMVNMKKLSLNVINGVV